VHVDLIHIYTGIYISLKKCAILRGDPYTHSINTPLELNPCLVFIKNNENFFFKVFQRKGKPLGYSTIHYPSMYLKF
jgi:hypothetical protein